MIKSFLVALDGSETSSQIISYVVALAKPLGAQLTLLTVVPPVEGAPAAMPTRVVEAPGAGRGAGAVSPPTPSSTAPTTAPAPGTVQSAEAKVQTEAQMVETVAQKAFDYLTAQAKALEQVGVKAFTHVARGDPRTEIIKVADETGAGAIAMSTRRTSALARGILGSVTDRVLHMSGRPLLVIQPKEPPTPLPEGWPRAVIVPLDGSELSETAIPMATFIAKGAGARMVFLRSMPLKDTEAVRGAMSAAEAEYGFKLERDRQGQIGYQYLDRFVTEAQSKGLEAEAQLYSGGAARRIVELANEIYCSLVVMTTHGASGFKRLMVGSVTDKVVRASGQAVMVLPPLIQESIFSGGTASSRPTPPPPPPPPAPPPQAPNVPPVR